MQINLLLSDPQFELSMEAFLVPKIECFCLEGGLLLFGGVTITFDVRTGFLCEFSLLADLELS